jgi:Flp pilus assembly protein TadG
MSRIQAKIRHALPASNYSFKEQGQAIVVIALMMVGIVAVLGLVLDGGNAYFQRRRTQNAADAAAFAGAIELANPTTGDNSAQRDAKILGKVNQYATANGISNPGANIVATYLDSNGGALSQIGLGNVPGNAKGVQVIPTLPFNTFFLGVVGESSGAVKAIAKASFAPISAPESIQPLAIPCNKAIFTDCFSKGDVKDIYEGSGSGDFGWLSWNGNNTSGYAAQELDPSVNTLSGYHDPHAVCPDGSIAASNGGTPCWMEGLPGVGTSSAVGTQLDAWITRGLAGIPMIIPVYDQCEPIDSKTGLCKTTGGGSNVNYRIKGFAAFILKSYNLPGKRVTGVFVNYVTPGKLCTSNCFDTGVYGIHLRP